MAETAAPAGARAAQDHPEDEESAAPPKEDKKANWDIHNRKEMLFNQMIHVGPKSFLAQSANIKPDKHGKGGVQYDLKKTWNTEILPKLKAAPEFKTGPPPMVWPADHQAVIQYVHRVVKKASHLYKQGEEQAEPAPAGTEGTKDERPLDEFSQALIEVNDLIKEAVNITTENAKKKAGAAAADVENEEHMQDAAAQSAYGAGGTRKKRRGGNGKAKAGASPAGAFNLDESDDDAPPSSKKAKKVPITINDYSVALALDPSEVLAKCQANDVPAGYSFVDTESAECPADPAFDEPYLLPHAASSSGGGTSAAATRDKLNSYLDTAGAAKKAKVDLEKTKEGNRADERKKELEIAEIKAKAEAKATKANAKATKANAKVALAMAKKMGMEVSESDESED